jgi:hypothetical protein
MPTSIGLEGLVVGVQLPGWAGRGIGNVDVPTVAGDPNNRAQHPTPEFESPGPDSGQCNL